MDETYRPDFNTFCEILRDYALHGLEHFKKQTGSVQLQIRAALKNQIADRETEIKERFAAIKSGRAADDSRFLPMPKPGGHDFLASFFLPRIERGQGAKYTCSFVVLWWVERDKGQTVALRLEPPEPKTAHAYPHWQFTRKVGDIVTNSETWLPDSYPAIPLGYAHPVELFLGVAAAVHGYDGTASAKYVQLRIRDAMARGSVPGRAEKLLGELARILPA